MPWPDDHKKRTRERIVRAAAEAFRARGLAGVRLDEVMAAAGLTHGGFYAHFRSKDDLLAEAIDLANEETVSTLSAGAEAPSSSAAASPSPSASSKDLLQAVLDAYLSPVHAAHPAHGCPVAALGPEIARLKGRARPKQELARGIRQRLEWMRSLFRQTHPAGVRESEVVGTLACLIGAVILARLMGGKESDEILALTRTYLHERLKVRQ